jgi:solute carrier family 35, member F5
MLTGEPTSQYIFSDHTYDKPFFVVYINTSLFAISLIPMVIHYVAKNGISALYNAAVEIWNEQRHGRRPLKSVAEEEDTTAGERLLVDDEGSFEDPDGSKNSESLSFRETAVLSLEFCMLWFFANYFASACLEYTSVGSVTILTSTSSVWTLIFCAVMRVEGFTVRKLVGVLASLVGIVLISTVDLSGSSDENRGSFPHKTTAQIAIGDAMAFISAIIYGLYVTVMKRRVGNEDRVNMPLFFGLVGLFNVAFLWPVFFVLHFTGVEPFEMPPTGKVWAIILVRHSQPSFTHSGWGG